MARETFTGHIYAPNEEIVSVSAGVEEKLLRGQGSFPLAGQWWLTEWRIEQGPALPDGIHKVKVIAYGRLRILDVKVYNNVVLSINELPGT